MEHEHEHEIEVIAPSIGGRWSIRVDGAEPVFVDRLVDVRTEAQALNARIRWPAVIEELLDQIAAAEAAAAVARRRTIEVRQHALARLRSEFGVDLFADLGAVLGVSKQRAASIESWER